MEPRKRPRASEALQPSSEQSLYRRGSIVRMKFCNFVTYENVEFFPGPLMNVVLGPNGTGKSSIVCAIALGLGASPEVLGRSKHASDFIKRGYKSGSIEIELKDAPRNLIIKRDITSDNHSTWHIDGKKTTEKEVLARVKALNIQVDNLCHFLPQEKVYKFAALTPQQRLEETERAVGMYDMLEKHHKLVTLRKEQKKDELSSTESNKHLEALRASNALLERDVLRFRERERLMAQVELLEKKKPWLQFEKQRQTAQELKEQHQAAVAGLKAKEAEHAPVQRQITALGEEVKNLDKGKEKLTADLKKFDQQRKKYAEEMNKLDDEYEGAKTALENLHKQAEERKEQLRIAHQELAKFQELLKKKRPKQDLFQVKSGVLKKLTAKNTSLTTAQQEVTRAASELRDKENEVRSAEEKLKRFADQKRQVLARLGAKEQIVGQIAEFLAQNRNTKMFREPVLGPICAEIAAHTPAAAKFLENALSKFSMTAFVCKTMQDWKVLEDELAIKRELKRWNVIRTLRLEKPEVVCTPADLKKFRAYDFLINSFDADEYVKQSLIDHAGLHLIVTAEENVDRNGLFAAFPKLRLVLTPTQQISCKVSRYGGQPSFSFTPLREAKIIQSGGDDAEKRRLQADLDAKKKTVQELQAELTRKTGTVKELHEEKVALEAERLKISKEEDEVKKLETNIKDRTTLIATLETEENTAEAEAKYRDTLQKLSKRRMKLAQDCHGSVNRMIGLGVEFDKIALERMQANARKIHLQREVERRDLELADLRREERRLKELSTDAMVTLKELKSIAEKKAPLTDELKAAFEDLPGTLEELNEQILNAQNKAKLAYAHNPRVIEEYEQRRQQIEDLEKAQLERGSVLDRKRAEIERLRGEWEPSIRDLVTKIDKTFAQLFARNNCEGRVELVPDEDFDKYALDIRVRFRDNEPLSVLNDRTQSGGERSVSTMLYLISLHELSACPFRVVDEINQGMDPRNERLVYTYTHNIASQPNRPQFFLITPKLLFDLEFNENTTVLVVNNGAFMTPQQEWQKVEAKLLRTE